MKSSIPVSLKLRPILALLLGLALIFGIFLRGGQEPSWAAPAQSPDQQTVPPRPPTPDPNPSPEPPPSPPEDDDDDDDDDDEAPPPPPPPEPTDEVPLPVPTPEPEEVAPPPTPTPEPEAVAPPPTPTPEPTDEAPPPTPSPAPEEDADSSLVIPQEADLSLSKVVDNPTPEVGEVITFSLTIDNNGPSFATNVVVSTPLPAGLSLKLAAPGQGSFNDDTGLWTVEIILPGQSVTLDIAVMAAEAGKVTNTAEIIAVDQADPDSMPGNGLESEDDQDSAPTTTLLKTAPALLSNINQSTQPDDNSEPSVSSSTSAPEPSVAEFGSLNWLYALGLGLILVLGGLVLTKRT